MKIREARRGKGKTKNRLPRRLMTLRSCLYETRVVDLGRMTWTRVGLKSDSQFL
jgi:hypothetical protein